MRDKKGNRVEYLGLLDTGSKGSLISKEVVEKHRLKTWRSKITWDINGGAFETGKTATTTHLSFLQFRNKQSIETSKSYVNPNKKQKYKAIFELDFLMENTFDFY